MNEKEKACYSVDHENGIIHVEFPDGDFRDYGFKHPTEGWVDDWKEVFEQRVKQFQEDDRFVVCDKQ